MSMLLPSTDFGVNIPFVRHMGFVLTALQEGLSEIRFIPRPEHLNSHSLTHGGAVMTLLDVTMAMAARAGIDNAGVVTIEMKTSFLRPSNGALTGHGKVLHSTATLAFTEGRVLDARGRMCAHATGTFKYVRRLPASSKGSQAPVSQALPSRGYETDHFGL